MKYILCFLLISLLSLQGHATIQRTDYIIIENDTCRLHSLPLDQYAEKYGETILIGLHSECFSTACWRGYLAYWEISNDSLFLNKITGCVEGCKNATDANLVAIFGSEKPFASWYTDTIHVSIGDEYYSQARGWSTSKYTSVMAIQNGRILLQKKYSNLERIEELKRDDSLHLQIVELEDTFMFYIRTYLDLETMERSIFDCVQDYILSYDENGKLYDVNLINNYPTDSATFIQGMAQDYSEYRCNKRIRKALKRFSLDYLSPHRAFKILISTSQYGGFHILEPRLYYENRFMGI